MTSVVDTKIEFLKGVGPSRGNLLRKELGIATYGDLIDHLPFRYVDRSKIGTIRDIDPESSYVVLKGRLGVPSIVTSGRNSRLSAYLGDGTGTIELVWFKGLKWLKDSLKPGQEYLVMGRPTLFNNRINIAHPDMEPLQYTGSQRPFIPVYSTTEKLRSAGLGPKGIAHLMEAVLAQLKGHIGESLPAELTSRLNLPPREAAYFAVHFPSSLAEANNALRRFKFEELFWLQLRGLYNKAMRQMASRGNLFGTVGGLFNRFYREKLPFELTGAQKRVIKEIREDMRSGHQMNRLLQGDVGSGKTMVALMTMLIACDNGYQCCLMAPTEILAKQHYDNICRQTDGLGLRVELLTGSIGAAKKRKIKEALEAGEVDILIGTHALIEPDVKFRRLGYVVVDEQHRFGVEQRSMLWRKSDIPPHVLVMTATPIPRTLSMTIYGDLDCSVIDELPPGRKPIKTIHKTDAARLAVFDFLRSQIAEGRQIYIVYPLINESEKSDLKDLMDGYESISRAFPMPQYQLSIVHGKMKADAKEYEMERFKKGIANIMVSTTVIEVGVDVPNATVMMIENAERFGLSQLHQLRGRVGRGGSQSYCILMTKDELSYTSKERIATMVKSNDGFVIAEADLRLRGPGDIEGLQQSGAMQLRTANLTTDGDILRTAHQMAQELLNNDPALQLPQNKILHDRIENEAQIEWGRIS